MNNLYKYYNNFNKPANFKNIKINNLVDKTEELNYLNKIIDEKNKTIEELNVRNVNLKNKLNETNEIINKSKEMLIKFENSNLNHEL